MPISIGLYLPTLNNYFVSEDLICVWEWGLSEAFDELTSEGVDVGYRPVSVLFWAVNRLLWGEEPLGYHVVGALLHGANAFLVFLLARRLFSQASVPWTAALLFLSAPVHTESLDWLAAMANTVTCSFFVLATAVLYLLWVDEGGSRRLAGSTTLFALALFTKELAVCLIVLLPLLDWRLGLFSKPRSGAGAAAAMVRRHGLYWLVLLIYIACYLTATRGVVAYGTDLHLRLGAFWLDHLSDYARWLALPWSEWPPLSSAGAVLKEHRLLWLPVLFATPFVSRDLRWSAAWIVASLLPVLSIPAARHHAYLAAAGSALLLASLISAGAERFGRPDRRGVFTVALAALFIAAGAWGTHRDHGPWIAASRETRTVPAATRELLPTLASSSRLFYLGIPDNVRGAYAFRWGLNEAIQMAYGDATLEAFKVSERPLLPNEIGAWTVDRRPGDSFLSYESGVLRRLDDREIQDLLADRLLLEQDRSETPAGEIWGSREVGQSFVAPVDATISRIDLLFATYRRDNHHPLLFHLHESPGGEDLAQVMIRPTSIEDNRWLSIRFPEVEIHRGETLFFALASPRSVPGDAFTVWSSAADVYAHGSLFEGAEPGLGDLRFRVFHRERQER